MKIEGILKECKERFKNGDIIKDGWGDMVIVDWENVKSNECDVWVLNDDCDNVYMYDSDREEGSRFATVMKLVEANHSEDELLSRIEELELSVDKLNEKLSNTLHEVGMAETNITISDLVSKFPNGTKIKDGWGDVCVVDWGDKANRYVYDCNFELVLVGLGGADVTLYARSVGITARVFNDNE